MNIFFYLAVKAKNKSSLIRKEILAERINQNE